MSVKRTDAKFIPMSDGTMGVEIVIPTTLTIGETTSVIAIQQTLRFTRESWDQFVKTGNEVFGKDV